LIKGSLRSTAWNERRSCILIEAWSAATRFMALLASVLAYLGAATGIAVAADDHNRISCYSQPAGNQATNVSDGVKAERTGGNDECNNEACTRGRPMEAARSFWTAGRFTNKGRRLYPPGVPCRESKFAKRSSGYAGPARVQEALGKPTRAQLVSLDGLCR
jgi:hypothetical protein